MACLEPQAHSGKVRELRLQVSILKDIGDNLIRHDMEGKLSVKRLYIAKAQFQQFPDKRQDQAAVLKTTHVENQ